MEMKSYKKMKTNINALLCLIFIVGFSQNILCQEEYLKQNKQEIDFDEFKDLSDLKLLSSGNTEIKVYLGGETHLVACNPQIKFKLLKYLHKNAGVKYYLLELPHSFAWLFNLELKKDTIPDWIERRLFYKKLYQYNNSLAESDRIEIIGADIERVHEQTIFVLEKIMNKDTDVPTEISARYKEIISLYNKFMENRTLTDSIRENLKSLAYELSEDLEKNETAYRKHLKKDFFHFDIIVGNLINNYEARWGESNELDNQQAVGLREKSMFETFLKFYPKLEGNVFGQWGSMHVRQDTTGTERKGDEISTWTNPNTFAYALNNNSLSPVKGKVISIGYNYLHCFSSQQNRQYSEKGIATASILDKETEDLMLKVSDSNFTLFKLTERGSPFKKLSSDFQYILLIQNQGPQKE